MTETVYTLTLTDVIRELKALAAERPDFVYEVGSSMTGAAAMCTYSTDDGKPDCIIGNVIHRLHGDEALKVLHDCERRRTNGTYAVDTSVDGPDFPSDRIVFDSDTTRNLCKWVQCAQDNGTEWGVAVQSGLRSLAL